MVHIYPYQSEASLREARAALERTKNPVNGDDLKRALLTFLNAARFCFQPLLVSHKGKLDGFDAWWALKGAELESDPVMAYFRDLRNRATKEGEQIVSVNWEIKGPVTLNGPLQISGDGTVYFASDRSTAFAWVPVPISGMAITMWRFKSHPMGYENLSSYGLCEAYLSGLEDVVGEFTETFGKLK